MHTWMQTDIYHSSLSSLALSLYIYIHIYIYIYIERESERREKRVIYRVSHELMSLLRESVPYVKLYRYNPKHLFPKFSGYGDIGRRSLQL